MENIAWEQFIYFFRLFTNRAYYNDDADNTISKPLTSN